MSTKNVLRKSLVLSGANYVTFLNVSEEKETLWKAFGFWCQTKREQAGKTQEDVAKDTGLHVKTISRIENGEPTKRDTVILLAKAIKANVNDALNRAGFYSPVLPPEWESRIRIALLGLSQMSDEKREETVRAMERFIRGVLAEMESEQKENEK